MVESIGVALNSMCDYSVWYAHHRRSRQLPWNVRLQENIQLRSSDTRNLATLIRHLIHGQLLSVPSLSRTKRNLLSKTRTPNNRMHPSAQNLPRTTKTLLTQSRPQNQFSRGLLPAPHLPQSRRRIPKPSQTREALGSWVLRHPLGNRLRGGRVHRERRPLLSEP